MEIEAPLDELLPDIFHSRPQSPCPLLVLVTWSATFRRQRDQRKWRALGTRMEILILDAQENEVGASVIATFSIQANRTEILNVLKPH